MPEIRENEKVTIKQITFREGEALSVWTLTGEAGGTEVFEIPLTQIENSGRRRWLVKSFAGKTFPKKSPTFCFEHPEPKTDHGVMVGPYTSLCLLRRNMKGQRGFIVKDVEDLANSMRTWHPSHQGIGLLFDGTMYDGQNRCLADVYAGTEIGMTLTRGMPLEAVLACDRQYRRTLIDNATMGGLIEDANVQGVHRTMVEATARNIHFEATTSNICNSEDLARVLAIYKPHLDALGVFYRSRFVNSQLLRESHIMAAMALAHRVYPVEAMEFFHSIAANSYEEEAQGYPPRRVAQFLQTRKGKTKIHSKKEGLTLGQKIVYKILWGFRFYLANRTCTSLNAEDSALLHLYPRRTDILREDHIRRVEAPVH